MSEAMRKPSESEADAKKRNSYEETPGGRPARRRAEEKDASDESTVLEVFLHCIAFRVRPCGGLAQLGERVLCKHEVVGSSPISSTSFSSEKHTAFGLIAQLVRAHA